MKSKQFSNIQKRCLIAMAQKILQNFIGPEIPISSFDHVANKALLVIITVEENQILIFFQDGTK